jgi:hypothetical protein
MGLVADDTWVEDQSPRARAASPRRPRMPRWMPELLVLALLYGAYAASRFVLRANRHLALENGHDILTFEVRWHLAPEFALNQILQEFPALAVASSYSYAALHYLVTPAVLIWIYRTHRRVYRRARTILVVSTALAVAGYYLIPTAPPRLLPGSEIGDTLAQYQGYGWWDTAGSVPKGMAGLANQYAAMPSLHVGWALWCGILIVLYARHRWVRMLGAIYPVAIAAVVMATGNHYLLDVVAGVATMALGAGMTAAMIRLRDAGRLRQSQQGVLQDLRQGGVDPVLPAGEIVGADGELHGGQGRLDDGRGLRPDNVHSDQTAGDRVRE